MILDEANPETKITTLMEDIDGSTMIRKHGPDGISYVLTSTLRPDMYMSFNMPIGHPLAEMLGHFTAFSEICRSDVSNILTIQSKAEIVRAELDGDSEE